MKAYRPYFSRVIRQYYPAQATRLLEAMEKHYLEIRPDVAFAASSANPLDRRLEMTSYFLATVMVLHGERVRYDEIRKVLLQVAHDYVQPKNKLAAKLRRWSTGLLLSKPGRVLIGAMARKTGRLAHPDGFVAELVTDPDRTYGLRYGVDITECGICKLFLKYNSQQYTPILCEVDHITTGLAGLELIRSGTIANGAQRCDFRFRRPGENGRQVR